MTSTPPEPGQLHSCRLTAPATPGSIDAVHELIDALWSGQPQLTDLDRMRFEGAVIEVAGNIVEHATVGLGDDEKVTIELALTAARDRIIAQFHDDGRPADIDLTASVMPDELAEGGRGLALARAMVDEVTYERRGPSNVWTLTCLRSDREVG